MCNNVLIEYGIMGCQCEGLDGVQPRALHFLAWIERNQEPFTSWSGLGETKRPSLLGLDWV